jgi:hypothetical protein
MASTDKCLAQSNKSRTESKATNKRRNLPAAQQFGLRDLLLNINSAATAQ